MDARAPQSQSAHAARSATRNRPRLRAVRDEAELSKHQESVPIPAKVLDLTIPCDADERGGNAHSLVGGRDRLGSGEGAGVRPCVDLFGGAFRVIGEKWLHRPPPVWKHGEALGLAVQPAPSTSSEG